MSNEPADDLRRVQIVEAGRTRASWAEGLRVSLPQAFLDSAGLSSRIDGQGGLRVPDDLPPADPCLVQRLRMRAAFTPDPPPSSRLPFNYRSVPGPLRRLVARATGRRHRLRVDRWADFPGWPIDLSADVLADLGVPGDSDVPRRTPVLLTHDIDSPAGLRNLVRRFLPIEEGYGARSTSFVVPCAWPLDDDLLREVDGRGHDLGIHGYDHANRTPFAEPGERRARLDAARTLAGRFGMVGYRAPSLLRTRGLLDDLATRYRFDSSMPTSGGLFPVPNNGCATARPFRIGWLVEIPISLPRDGSLQFLGHSPDEIVRMWRSCAELVARSGGTVVLLTHCEDHFTGGPDMLRAYGDFLEWVARDKRFAWASPRDVMAGA